MPLNDEEQPLSTLGQAIVPNGAPVVTQDAVQKLIDAYHQGYITTNDIMEHSGAVAAARGTTALQELKISPDLVAAKKAQANFQTAQANAQLGILPQTTEAQAAQAAFQTADAKAQMGILPHAMQVKEEQLTSAQAQLNDAEALKEYHSAGFPTIRDENGNPDNLAMAAVGGRRLVAKNQLDLASKGLGVVKQAPMPEPGPKGTTTWKMHEFNASGEDITRPFGTSPGTAAYERYSKLHNDSQEVLTEMPKMKPSGIPFEDQPEHLRNATPVSAQSVLPKDEPPAPRAESITPQVQAAPPPPVILPSALPPFTPSTPNEARAWLAQAGAMSVPAASTLTDPMGAYQSYLSHASQSVSPAAVTPITQPVIAPSAVAPAAPVAPTVPTSAVAPAAPAQTPGWPMYGEKLKAQEAWQKIQQQELYQNWSQKFEAVKTIERFPSLPEQEIKNQDDSDLITAVKLVSSPSTSMKGSPDMQAKAIKEAQPVREVISEAWAELTKKKILSDKTRQRLLAVGTRHAENLKFGAASVIRSQAPLTAFGTMVPQEDFLSGPEKELLNQYPDDQTQPGGGSKVAGPVSAPVRIGNRIMRLWNPSPTGQ